jgi:hypothetical protein
MAHTHTHTQPRVRVRELEFIYIPEILLWAKPKDAEHVIIKAQNLFHI